jgi:hypothetical protein
VSRAPWSTNYNVQSKEMNCCKPIVQRAFRHPSVNPEVRREVEAAGNLPAPPYTQTIAIKLVVTQEVKAVGIAPASQIPQVVSQHDICVEDGCQWLHDVCTEAALRELVAAWHGLAREVREKIVGLARTFQV